MKRIICLLPTICLAIVATLATHGWTQDDAPRERGPTERKVGTDEDGGRQKPPAAREVPAGDEANARNAAWLNPLAPGRGLAAPDGRNGGRDGQVPMRTRTVSKTVSVVVSEPVDSEELAEIMALREARQDLRDAKDEAARKTAAEAIRQHLEKQFGRDLAQREQELAAVEERVRQLRQQVEKRTRSKDEIVTLRLKTILNNADGLGFPGDDDLQDPSANPYFAPVRPSKGRGAILGLPAEPEQNRKDPQIYNTPQPFKLYQPAPGNPGEGRPNNKDGRAEPR